MHDVRVIAGLYMAFKLAEIRRSRFLSQRELAKLTGLSQSTIGNLELGKQQPQFKTIRLLAVALAVEPQQLFDDMSTEDGEDRTGGHSDRTRWPFMK